MFVHVNGIQLAYSDTGSGEPVALLVHGFPLNRSMWDPQIGVLRAAGIRVIAPDLRGFGASEAGAAGLLTMDQHADDLLALLDAVGVSGPVVYVGLSMGGYVGFALWRRGPERVAAFVLADTRASPDSEAELVNRRTMIERAEAEGSPQVAIDVMRPRLFSPSLRGDAAVVRQVLGMMSGTAASSVADGARGLAARPSSFETLGTITVPTLVVVGEHDLLTPPSDAAAIAEGVPGARLVTIDQAGHMANMENPSGFNEALEEFLTSFATGGRRAR